MWSDKIKFFCPRSSSGSFHCPGVLERLNPLDNNYVEGDAWQYRFFVPHAIQQLSEMYGATVMKDKLIDIMDLSKLYDFNVLPNPYFWAGNEPDLLVPWQLAFVNASSNLQVFLFSSLLFVLSTFVQEAVRWQMANRFSTMPDGLPGNDDYGAISCWYLWGAMGLYPGELYY